MRSIRESLCDFATYRRFRKNEFKLRKENIQTLSEEVFFNKKVGLLHGKLSSQEKNEVINSFLKNEINILVSTTVIELSLIHI